MKKHLLILIMFLAYGAAQSNTSIDAIRKIRLDNLERNYLNKTIRFYIPGSVSVEGELLKVTEKSFIVSENNTPSTYSHENVKYVFIDPSFNDLLMVFAISAIGGASSYMGALILKDKPDAAFKGVATSAGAGVAGIFAKAGFYKPIKIDISGEAKI
jgi:hypothetical protein